MLASERQANPIQNIKSRVIDNLEVGKPREEDAAKEEQKGQGEAAKAARGKPKKYREFARR